MAPSTDRVLVTGSSRLLAARLAACLAAAGADVRTVPGPLHGGLDAGQFGPVRAVWCVSEGCDAAPRRGSSVDAACCTAVLDALPGLGAAELTWVGPLYRDAPGAAYRRLEHEVAARCAAAGVACRAVAIPTLAATEIPSRTGLGHLVTALDGVLGEVGARDPDYFRRHPLRCLAPDRAVLDLVAPERAAAAAAGQSGSAWTPVAFTDVCEQVGRAFGVTLRPESDPGRLSAIDRLFTDRLNGFVARLRSPAGPGADGLPLDATLGAARGALGAATLSEPSPSGAPPGFPELPVAGSLAAWAGGPDSPQDTGGLPLLLMNALGQEVGPWSRLAVRLARRHRVLTWEARAASPDGRPLRLEDQAADAEAVLRAGGAAACHLVAWCTAPKVAVELWRRQPGVVRSMVFLNGTFKCDARPELPDSAYEHNLEGLCRLLAGRPSLAARLLPLLHDAVLGVGGDQDRAVGVLAAADPRLREARLAPFRDEAALVSYAQQLLDFWAHDALAAAGRVTAPVLFVGAELDAVVSTPAFRRAAGHFPHARYAEIAGATHYCLHDRADLVADLVSDFVADPGRVDEIDGEVRWESGTGLRTIERYAARCAG